MAPSFAESRGDKVVAAVDIDHVKTINDQLGHDTGDEVLQAVAGRIRRGLSRDDLLIRWGGDEFVIVLEVTDNEAMPVLNLIRRAVAEQPVRTDDAADPVTVSIAGVVVARGLRLTELVGRPAPDLHLVAEASAAS